MEWLENSVVPGIEFPQNSLSDSFHLIMMLAKFWARSEINCSKKLDNSSSLEVRSVNGVLGALHSFRD